MALIGNTNDDVPTRAERIPSEAANVDRRSMEWKRGLILVLDLCSSTPTWVGSPTTTATVFGKNRS